MTKLKKSNFDYIVFDIELKEIISDKGFNETIRDHPERMKFGLAVVYESKTDKYTIFEKPKELINFLMENLNKVLIVGYNHHYFDLKVLQRYCSKKHLLFLDYIRKPLDYYSYDICQEVYSELKYRLQLDNLGFNNIKEHKPIKIDWNKLEGYYKDKKLKKKIIEHCKSDVFATKELFKIILKNKELKYGFYKDNLQSVKLNFDEEVIKTRVKNIEEKDFTRTINILHKQKGTELKKQYYGKKQAVFEMVKQLQYKELAILEKQTTKERHSGVSQISIRFCWTWIDKYLTDMINRKVLGYEKVNLYRGIAYLRDTKNFIFSLNLKERQDDPKYKQFNEEFEKHIRGLDFVIDIDGENFKEVYKIAKKVKSLYDKYKIPYSVFPTSNHGFHFLIEFKYIIDYFKGNINYKKLLEELYMVTKNIAKKLKITTDSNKKNRIDMIMNQLKRVVKLPYSYSEGYIVLPLDDTEFNNLNEEYFKAETIIEKIEKTNFLFDRRMKTRTYNLSESKLSKNVSKLINDFKFKGVN